MTLTSIKTHTFRHPNINDGKKVWELVREIDVLDLNSSYYYLILCEYFSNTCMIAENEGEIVGFVSGFRHPEHHDILFVWQVAVAESERGEGLATTLIQKLLKSDECSDIKAIQTTISPSNKASLALFRKLSEQLGANMVKTLRFSPDAFPGNEHEAEQTYEISPILRNRKEEE
ncbi:diaminobutyrate acetyltransferase [Alteribacillus sp. YIM 98480]|uniref:diaminobutyrate acetyltransferase n=1 Tax=Alteribacillus sp. YIM 98480 TaxID=2606599 RepID=UPI00131C3290|nr:diaminobutyrate acetyltransferase [Alteribacillus sp. YIM 98480]